MRGERIRKPAVRSGLGREEMTPHEVVALLNVAERYPDIFELAALVAQATLEHSDGPVSAPENRYLRAWAAWAVPLRGWSECRACGLPVVRSASGQALSWPFDIHYCGPG